MTGCATTAERLRWHCFAPRGDCLVLKWINFTRSKHLSIWLSTLVFLLRIGAVGFDRRHGDGSLWGFTLWHRWLLYRDDGQHTALVVAGVPVEGGIFGEAEKRNPDGGHN